MKAYQLSKIETLGDEFEQAFHGEAVVQKLNHLLHSEASLLASHSEFADGDQH